MPGNDLYTKKKDFEWELYIYEETKLGIRFKFDNPEYISVGETDTMRVEFNNTEVYVPPVEEGSEILPSGFTMMIKIPP